MYIYCLNNPVNLADSTGQLAVPNLSLVREVISLFRRFCKNYNELRASNYKTNRLLDRNPRTTSRNKIIWSQENYSSFRYGNYSVDYNGCEIIAVHNARYLMDLETSLSGVIDVFFENDAMLLSITNGCFGSDPYKIGSVLEYYGMSYEMVKQNEWTRSGIYILSYWTEKFPHQIHTVTVEYYGKYYIATNPNGQIDPYLFGSRYICGYYLGDIE